jgi:hypothetical protein
LTDDEDVLLAAVTASWSTLVGGRAIRAAGAPKALTRDAVMPDYDKERALQLPVCAGRKMK